MNLENYLSATLPTAVVAKIFEANSKVEEDDEIKKTESDAEEGIKEI